MKRALAIIALAAAALGCSSEPEAPQAVAVAMTAPQEAADKEVLIATQPAGAKILLKGAEVGQTPMKLLIRDDTNIVLEKEGFVRQALMLTPKSDPNVVVTLVPAEGGAAPAETAAAAAPEPEQKGSSTSKSGKKADKGGDKVADATAPTDGAGATGSGAGAETAPTPPATPPATATPPPSSKKTEYTTMRQIKDALREGKITKTDYSYWQGIIRQKRQAEFDAVKKDLKEKKITEDQYEEKIRAIKVKYEG